MEAILCKNIVKNFGTVGIENAVLKNISLSVEQGEFVSIVGPSGSGKSTLLYILGGLDRPTEGQVFIKDKEIYKYKDRKLSEIRRNNIGFIYQFYNLMPNLTVNENIMVPALIRKEKYSQYTEKITKLLNEVGLGNKENAKPSELSGGQQQRVAIVRALINDTDIILADEPIGNLDSKSGQEIMKLLQTINVKYNKTIIQITHSMDSVKYGTRVITLKDGVIESNESIEENNDKENNTQNKTIVNKKENNNKKKRN